MASVVGTAVHSRMPLMPSGLLYAERSSSVFWPKFSVRAPTGWVR